MRGLPKAGDYPNSPALEVMGLSSAMLKATITYAYDVLDSLDATLISKGETRLAGLLELANLSAIVGNLFRAGIARASNGQFKANGPHKYPDLLSTDAKYGDIEIKVALETNKPKGHLIKPGPHMTVRYVLGRGNGLFERGKPNRGDVVWIWEVRVGILDETHFSISNTAGDSGKTAVINKAGMEALKVVFCDLDRCPHPPGGSNHRTFSELIALKLV